MSRESIISRTQYGIYLECISNPETTTYNLPFLLHIPESLSIEYVKECFVKCIEAHEGLSSRPYTNSKGDVFLKSGYPIETSSFELSDGEFEERKKTLVRPFSMNGESLIRVEFYTTPSKKYLFMDIHHLIYDGSSHSVLFEDFKKALKGEDIIAEEYSFHDLNEEELTLRDSDEYTTAKNFYSSILDGIDVDCAPLPDVENEEVAQGWMEVDVNIDGSRLKELKNQHGISKSAFYTTVAGFVVARFNSTKQSVISTVYSGRNNPKYNRTVTMMVKTMPVVTDFEHEKNIINILKKAQNNLIESRKNTLYSYVDAAADFGLVNDINVAYQGNILDYDYVAPDGFHIERLYDSKHIEETKLLLEVADLATNDIRIHLGYRKDCYSDFFANTFIKAFVNACKGFLSCENIGELSLTDDADISLLDSFNDNRKEYNNKQTVVEQFRDMAKKYPDNNAVVFKEKKITYRELDNLTDRLAIALSKEGIGRDKVVSILIPRCEYMVITALAVMKAGGIYQPLDSTYPAERLNLMVNDSEATILITTPSLSSIINDDFKGKRIMIEDIPLICSNTDESFDVQSIAPSLDDTYILLYTSGSTGVPKGVRLLHSNIITFCAWVRDYQNLDSESKWAAYASFGFDANMYDTYPTLTSGAELHIIEEDMRLDLMRINQYFNDNRISHAFMTTQIGRQFAEIGELPYLKFMSLGGEKLAPMNPPKFRFCNVYGPTETTVLITCFEIDKYYKDIPIGKAIDNVTLYVVDADGNRLPALAAGELWVAGPQVSAGYLNRPEKTAEVFITNPFSDEADYRRVYRTGDIVRYLPDGNIQFIGRRDAQVKVRGFRIELTEVEEIIRRFPQVADVTTKAFDEPTGGKYIAAYVVSKDGKEIDIKAMNQFIMEEKPPYMVPAVTMQIDAIPYNQNQKVNKKVLPEPKRNVEKKNSGEKNYDNAITLKIKELLKAILAQEDYDYSEDLSAYGLNSLGMIRLIVGISEAFAVECDIKELRKGCSIRRLEEIIITNLLNRNGEGEPKNKKEEVINIAPLSGPQFGVYAECMKNHLDTRYNISFAYEFSKDMDANRLAEAVKTVLLAHPSIFSTLSLEENGVCQKRCEDIDVEIPIVNVEKNKLKDYMSAFKSPFKLMNSRLFNVEIVKTESGLYLLTDFHHIIFDGSSVGIFINQLKDVLEGREIKQEEYDYFSFVNNRNDDDGSYKKAEDYFAMMLSNCDHADEITPDITGELTTGKSAISSAKFDMQKIDSFCQEHKVTPAHLFLAAVFYVVSRFTNSRSAYICTISNGRYDVKTKDTFGMFVNTLPLGIEIGDYSSLELVNKAKEIFNGAMDNEIYPFSEIAAKYNYSADIFYAYQIGINENITINGKELKSIEIGDRPVKFKTGIYIEKVAGETVINVVYSDGLYSKSLMDTFVNCILASVYGIIAAPNNSVRKLSMLTEEKKLLVEEFSHTKLEENDNKLLHGLFEKQVAIKPNHIAIIAIDGSFTYKELDERANRVANALLEKGLGKNAKVVLLLERTSSYFAALFGVLKAGAAFIPTCPDYPKERISSIIEDSDARFVISFGKHLEEYSNAVDISVLEACENVTKPDIAIKPEDLAYLIYTSGSTGKPKGVMLRHIGIANYLTDNIYNPQVNLVSQNCICFGSVTTVSFDMNFKETLNALCNGLTLAFASDEMTMDPLLLANFLLENKVDVFNATPSRLLVYMEVNEFEQAMKNCKIIMSGGEKYPDKLLQVLREKTNARILNTYGPTEITVSSNAAELTNAKVISVGRPLYNYKEYIVDLDDNKLPANVVGELIIGGCGVALGYNKLEEQTKKAFITYEDMPFYRSGDYARFTDNGEVVILGRKDNQIKLRGLRIELDEIEKVLTSIEGIRSGKVLIKKIGKEEEICAYFTSSKDISPEEIKAVMAGKLTDYMIPAAIIRLDEMPLTANGKVNEKLLPEPKINKADRKIEKPNSEAEKVFCDIFKSVLSLDEVSATDSFFDIGGSSLTVVSVAVMAAKKNYEVSFSDIFDNPTPRKLAKFVSGGVSESANPFGSISDYDYSNINKVLEGNNLNSFVDGELQELGDVILTGATGFLGIHVLNSLLKNYTGKIYCLLRKASKLETLFHYYFSGNVFREYGDRIKVFEGSITDAKAFEQLKDIKADTFINCAANVKHFSEGTDIEDVNYYGVKNILAYCKEANVRLIQVSTMSVGGLYFDVMGLTDRLSEDMLYIGQSFNSKYTNSKYLAEREILEAVANGFNAKIMRVGNLSARDYDGEFQINYKTNSSMGRIKAAYVLGTHPYSALQGSMEFSPIDCCADAILMLARTPKECVVFHPYNNHSHIMEEVYTAMNEVGLATRAVEDKEYANLLELAKQDPEKNRILSSFMAYERVDGRKTFMVGKKNDYTMQVLYRMNFRWPVSSLEYMRSFISMLEQLGYFEF